MISCSTTLKPIFEPKPELAYPDLSVKKFCRGQGYILSEGEMKGRLNFTFTSSRDTAYIQFKDLIGRKTIFLILNNENIDAWDMLNNRRYDRESILISLPFFEMIEPKELRTFLWGSIPPVFSEPDQIKSQSVKVSGGIEFRSAQTPFGPLIEHVSFNMRDEKYKIDLVMMNREFDVQYPHLIRNIPTSVIPIKVNS